MTDSKLLRKRIKSCGFKYLFVAEQLGISGQCLYNKIDNRSEFKAPEIKTLTSLLNLSSDEREKIFFANL